MMLAPIPGTLLQPEPKADKVELCLRHWVRTARGMHTETWTAWADETREALHEYQANLAAGSFRTQMFDMWKTSTEQATE